MLLSTASAEYFGLDVVHVHDDDPADAAELEGAAAYNIPHVAAFELGYGMLQGNKSCGRWPCEATHRHCCRHIEHRVAVSLKP